ncbi:uncharacterized protein LOC111710787 [Eurytemora carolleeae]|uniref:uncharacterized protein LOC111710787 n=1 Tax=Eurytemora carolleeae TaxID=1294199 RepID=UPI000C766860|nr:uncharacterized protein LOC111710787 [Eurytemora carolleeae]|eukprot:XP_023340689.1 uncharacterized protein LOC111710787 [Eurytemora affinis]
MPRVRQRAFMSLQRLCIENVCQNMDEVWSKHFLDYFYKKSHCKFIIGPFDSIIPSLSQEIFVSLKERKQLRRHHIYLLISIYHKLLDFSGCEADLNLMLQITLERCYKLEQLNISRCMKIPRGILNNLISTVGGTLLKIEVSSSNIGDDFLSVVGVYCPNLRALDVSFTSVSDKGVRTLVLQENLDGSYDERYGKSTQIAAFKVQGCQKITDEGAALVLEKLTNLVIFDYCNTVGAVQLLLKENTDLIIYGTPCSIRIKQKYGDVCNLNLKL